MNLSGIRNIVFDLGGVILTLDPVEAFRRFESLGIADARAQLNTYHQSGIFLQLETGELSEEAFFEAFRQEAGRPELTDDQIRWAWMGFVKDCPLYKLEMLDELKAKGFRIFLLSNTNPCIMHWARSSQFSPSGRRLDDYFDKLYLSYEMGVVKPHAEIFEQMLHDGDMVAEETLFIDDAQTNVEAAAKLGLKTYQPANGEDFRILFA